MSSTSSGCGRAGVASCLWGEGLGLRFVLVTLESLLFCDRQVLVDAPDMVRCIHSMKRLALTDLKVTIQRIPKKTALVKALEEAAVARQNGGLFH
eukprot:6621555-Pyramimonas_sp.AAC.1